MIYAQPTVFSLVTETFNRTIREHGQDQDVECIRLKDGVARTLATDRYVQLFDEEEHPEQQKAYRRLTCEGIRQGAAKAGEKLAAWRAFAQALTDRAPNSLIFARLQSRLMVNMAGGVMENGGLCLDRTSGVPFIPGSAVKGCARRVALAALREWSESRQKPSGDDNPLGDAVAKFASREVMLEVIALIFGWGDQEWSDDSDFAWACGCGAKPTPEQNVAWQQGRITVSKRLCEHLGIVLKDGEAQQPWKRLPNFAGTMSFLPAYPWDGDLEIELDVITGHHPEYYSEKKDRSGNLLMPVALDAEEPVPVIFPAVKADGQPRFGFVILPTARADTEDLEHAHGWLADGLEIFGIGAKTNAGYGWFIPEDRRDKVAAAEAARLRVNETLAKESTAREEDLLKKEEADEQARKLKAETDLLAAQKAADDAKTAEHWVADYLKMDDSAFATQAKSIETMRGAQRHGFVLALASSTRAATRKRWKDGKQKEVFKRWQDFAATLRPPVTL